MLRSPFRESLVSWTLISDHILHARVAHRHEHLTEVLGVCSDASEIKNDTIKDSFYNQLSAIIQSISPRDNLIMLDDLNAMIGPANFSASYSGAIKLGHAK